MLDSIEEVHDRGFIHRDVKAVSTPYVSQVLLVKLRPLKRQQACVHR